MEFIAKWTSARKAREEKGTHVAFKVLSNDFVNLFERVGRRLTVENLHRVDEFDRKKIFKGADVLSHFYVHTAVETTELEHTIGGLLMRFAALLAVLLGRFVPVTEVKVALVNRGYLHQGPASSCKSNDSDATDVVIVVM